MLLKENVPSEGLKQLAHVVQEGFFLYPVAIKSGRISGYIYIINVSDITLKYNKIPLSVPRYFGHPIAHRFLS